ncbi:hypothetical protein BRUCa_2832 [Brucella melitensis]|uniref:Uncharacterized protein n=2 Tax=Brucella TaxID=234 RepID=A9MBY0_BRUC2|nr:hypothetical protein BOV_A0651 [Brucella ovis ATCC 25840]ABX63867.1 Hypothetical protein, conserved [Brucella canis ATCC 23365]ADZ67910.1 conserved hypothetical protein [Brucella melitensis M28]ADZ88777.1 conserved hypothetical protein [Brucella melitensis M5-90]AEW15315.1 hypothetical protein BCA52141_II0244 [Brucella canis HSK A52141]AEW19238.1 hypothetical protein BAA13334_II01093 [Brucella abortus A13334]AIB19336.1 Hypothetical protein BSSP3_II0647 [Brucella suis bv. 2]EFG36181.1 hypo
MRKVVHIPADLLVCHCVRSLPGLIVNRVSCGMNFGFM